MKKYKHFQKKFFQKKIIS